MNARRSTPRGFAGLAAAAVGVVVMGLGRLVAAGSQPLPIVVVTGDPAGPALTLPGTGLCVTNAISMSPATDFPQSVATYAAGINAFLEMHVADRVTLVMQTIFDLSNNNSTGLMLSYGDFTNDMAGCGIGGCGFFVNDTTTSFATRVRGFLNVTAAMVDRPFHFGFYCDDSVSLVILDKTQTQYPVVTRPPVLGAPTWRTTNTVMFTKAGLYPIEILYTEIVEHAALEMSFLDSAVFMDEEVPANSAGSTNLKTAGFTLFNVQSFFETLDGTEPFIDPTQCAQCNRQFAGLPGNGGCMSSYYCNEAALCAPCDTALYCGPSCSPCGGNTPFCVNVNGSNQCGQCRMDSDCPNGLKCQVDTHMCQQCKVDADCGAGLTCQGNSCLPCSSVSACAGVSCNCCPGANLKCVPLNPGEPPSCIECQSDQECTGGLRCDTINGHCVAMIPAHETPAACGDQALACPPERPYCLDGQVCVACRADFQCAAGQFCESGQCMPCTTDRHCGARCAACAGDTPFCNTDGTTAHSACVRCRADDDCVGGPCDTTTHTCAKTCAMTCPQGMYCDGARCVQCYSNAQCPCGGSCNLVPGTCATACTDSGDCLGTQYCTLIERACVPGRQEPGTDTSGGPCCRVAGMGRGRGEDASGSRGAAGWVALGLAAAAIVAGARRRSRRG